jgi:hypothetical protein
MSHQLMQGDGTVVKAILNAIKEIKYEQATANYK